MNAPALLVSRWAQPVCSSERVPGPWLPALGLRLGVALFLIPGAGANPRALHCCTVPYCPCAGVYFKKDAHKDCHLRLRVFLERAPLAGGAAESPMDKSAAAAARELMQSHKVRWRVEHDHNPVRETAAELRRVWVPDASLPGGGQWEISLQPVKVTGVGRLLARVWVALGPNVVTTAPFTVCDQPSEWVSVSLLPSSTTRRGLRELVARVVGTAAFTAVMCDSDCAGLGALIKFTSREDAVKAYSAWSRAVTRPAGIAMSFVATPPRVARGQAPPPRPPARLAVHVTLQGMPAPDAEPSLPRKRPREAGAPDRASAHTQLPPDKEPEDLGWLDCVSPAALGVLAR